MGICMVLRSLYFSLVCESMSVGPLTFILSKKIKEKREKGGLQVFARMKAGLRSAWVLPYPACLRVPQVSYSRSGRQKTVVLVLCW